MQRRILARAEEWIKSCKERVNRRDEYSHVIYAIANVRAADLNYHTRSDASKLMHAPVSRIYDSRE